MPIIPIKLFALAAGVIAVNGEDYANERGTFLIADISHLRDSRPDLALLSRNPGNRTFAGVIIKATEGTTFADPDFAKYWQLAKTVAPERIGRDWFRGAYHYLSFSSDGSAQADHFCDVVENAGGFGDGTSFIPALDIEWGQKNSKGSIAGNALNSEQLADLATAWCSRVKQRTGRRTMLYGATALSDKHVSKRMGFDEFWNPSWTATMRDRSEIGWPNAATALWQYAGDGVGNNTVHKLPLSVPGFGQCDLSVFVDGKNRTTLESLRRRLL